MPSDGRRDRSDYMNDRDSSGYSSDDKDNSRSKPMASSRTKDSCTRSRDSYSCSNKPVTGMCNPDKPSGWNTRNQDSPCMEQLHLGTAAQEQKEEVAQRPSPGHAFHCRASTWRQ